MAPSCPRCHLKTDRGEPDYFIGAFTVNFVAAELLIVGVASVWVWLSWPDVPWTLIQWGLIALMIPAPVVFYPFAKTIWLAIDLTFRPVTWADLQGHGENEGFAPRPGNDSPPGGPRTDGAGVEG
jgi:hypothetical protein